jgi:cytoskeletal protein RodZ
MEGKFKILYIWNMKSFNVLVPVIVFSVLFTVGFACAQDSVPPPPESEIPSLDALDASSDAPLDTPSDTLSDVSSDPLTADTSLSVVPEAEVPAPEPLEADTAMAVASEPEVSAPEAPVEEAPVAEAPIVEAPVVEQAQSDSVLALQAAVAAASAGSDTPSTGWQQPTRAALFALAAIFAGGAVWQQLEADQAKYDFDHLNRTQPTDNKKNYTAWYDQNQSTLQKHKDSLHSAEILRTTFGIAAGVLALGGVVTFVF